MSLDETTMNYFGYPFEYTNIKINQINNIFSNMKFDAQSIASILIEVEGRRDI